MFSHPKIFYAKAGNHPVPPRMSGTGLLRPSTDNEPRIHTSRNVYLPAWPTSTLCKSSSFQGLQSLLPAVVAPQSGAHHSAISQPGPQVAHVGVSEECPLSSDGLAYPPAPRCFAALAPKQVALKTLLFLLALTLASLHIHLGILRLLQ